MDSYFELCRRWCKPILLHLAFFFAFTQFSTAQDFDVTAQANENGALEVKWYTKHQNQRFRIILKNQETQKETRHIILNSGKFVLDKYDPLTDYQITVENLGNDDKVLRAGSEKFLGRVTLQNYAQQFAAKANPNTINANLQVVMRALNAQSFPFIYSTIDVSDGVAGVDNLSVANFKAYEDGARQTNHFNVTPAGTGGGTRILDMIFIIDDSGSMGDEQQAVINNVNNFVDQLVIRNINFRLGLVRFGQNANSGNPILMNNGNMTDDVELFKQILSTFQAAGGTEPGIQAVYDAATSFSFRPGSQRHFLLITDEDSDGGDLTATINVCNNNGIIVHSATLCTSGSSQTDYCDSNSIRGQTGGIQKSVIGPYDDILDAILKDVASSYIVSYRTINDVATSGLREVKINVDALGQNKNVIGYYGFGWPIITLTNRTINLSKTGQLQNTAVLIQVKVTDSSQPFVQSVLCYYRQTGTSSWSSLTMVHVGNNIYEATIPAYAVVEPGMDYYIRATDGQTTSTYPEQDPSIYPVQFAVLPNQPPAISHTPVLTTAQNTAVSINAIVTDNTNNVQNVRLYYRSYGSLAYSSTGMGYSNGTYSAQIPGTIISSSGAEYYIRALDDLGVASVHGVHLIEINGSGNPNCPPDIADNFEDGVADGWIQLNPNRWEVIQDGGYHYYGINTTVFNAVGDEALGEFAVLNSQDYEDFKLSVYAKSTEDLATNAFADYAVVFGYIDAQNYHYLMINRTRDWSQVFRVDNNIRTTLFDLEAQIDNNDFHLIHLEKTGSKLDVYYNGLLVGSSTNLNIPPGRMGVGSYNDGAYFDDFQITTDCTPTENRKPVILHTPITIALPGSPIKIAATVTDHTDYVSRVQLHYRKTGTSQYTFVNMPLSGSKYVANIPATEVTGSGIEYYISASDNLGLAAYTSVYVINVNTGTICPTDFVDDFQDGNANEWTLNTPSRWSFQNDNGNMKFYINTTQYLSPDGNRLGEYAVVNGKYYADFTLKCEAKTETAGPANYFVDLAIVFGFQDENNYYYAGYSSKEEYNGLYVIKNAIRTELATYDPATMGDSFYHDVQITRDGSLIYVYFDGQLIMTADDATFSTGQVGIGSFNDQAWFDNFMVESCISNPPLITHTPVATAIAGSAIPVSAHITDVTDYVNNAELYYRIKGSGNFTLATMSANGSTWSATIPANIMTSAGVEYYLRAYDNLGYTSRTSTYHIREQLPACTGDFSENFEDGNANGWQPVTPGSWNVAYLDGSNVYNLHTAATGDEWSLLSTKKWGDFAIEFEARSTANIYKNYTLLFGVPTLSDGNDNGYYLKFGVGNVNLYKQENGSGTLIKSVNRDYVDDNYYHRIRVEHEGSEIRVWADGQQVFVHSDNTWQSGYIGLNVFKSTSRFDNVCISALQPETTIFTPVKVDAAPGHQIIIPVRLTTSEDISFLQLTFDYDNTIINFIGAQAGNGVPGFNVGEINANPAFSPQTPGTNKNVIVQLSGNGTASFTGTDVHILNLEFVAVGGINTVSPLEIDKECSHSFLTTSDPFDMCGNTLHTNRTYIVVSQSSSISGEVRYFTQTKPVANTIIELRENNQFVKSANSDSTGHYTLTNLAAVPYTINASKSSDIGSAITGSDVLHVMRFIAFIGNPDAHQRIAADVDKNGLLTGADVVAILRHLAFLQSGTAYCGTWRFMPEGAQVNPATSSQQDFTGYILGDVNGSWRGNTAPKIGAAGQLAWKVSRSEKLLKLSLYNKGSGVIHTGQLSLNWYFAPKNTPAFRPAGGAMAATSPLSDGQTHFAFASLEGFNSGDKIGEINLNVEKEELDSAVLVRVLKAILNDLPGDVPDIEQETLQAELPENITLYANYPNPFNIATHIKFAIPEKYAGQQVRLQIYTITGVKIRDILQQKLESGLHEVTWDGRDMRGDVVSSGVYLYRLQVGAELRTKKLMLLK